MLKFGNKEFNNLQEQVLKNTNDLQKFIELTGGFIGVKGDKGDTGERGPQGLTGIRGSQWTIGTNLPASANNGDIHLDYEGNVYIYNGQWVLNVNIRGPQGLIGRPGPQGLIGRPGPQGLQGPQGPQGEQFLINGPVANVTDLPSISTVEGRNIAFLVGASAPYALYVISENAVTHNLEWTNAGSFATLDNIQTIILDVPDTATEGTLTQDQLDKLANNDVVLQLGYDVYRKTENQSDDGYWVYTSFNNSDIRTITVMTAGSWIKNRYPLEGQWTASTVSYDNTNSGLDATNVQSAIDEPYRIEQSTNLLNYDEILQNHYVWEGIETENPAYDASGFIKVSEGDVITLQETEPGSDRVIKSMRFVNAFNENKQTLNDLSAGSSESYIVPNGVKYIRVSFAHREIDDLERYKTAIVNSSTIIPYEDYWKKTYFKNELIDEKYILEATKGLKIDIEQCNFASTINLFNKNSSDILIGSFVSNGYITENSSYSASGFIEVKPNTQYAFFTSNAIGSNARFVDEYDENKVFIQGTNYVNPSSITTTANTKYIRASFYAYGLDTFTIVEGSSINQYIPYGYKIDREYLRLDDATSVLAFLPKDIYCAVGRTIELYNEQVVLQAKDYHFSWSCNIGKGLKRKFSVEGIESQIGDYPLTLTLYNNDLDVVWTGSSTLHIVPAHTGSMITICPIGDSLTNGKYWLNEVRNIAGNWIGYVGTRGTTNNLKHEGRSGWSTVQYLSNSTYDYELPATPNPFWYEAGNAFSWTYYKGTYGIYPTMVQIFLGTNDLLSLTKEQFATNIKTMVDAIRSDDANIPIMLVLTLCWGNQNGIGVQESTDGFAALSGYFKYKQDEIIIAGTKYLEEFIKSQNYTNVFFVPITQCHDSENNFGAVPTLVNPRASADQIELMPIEAVHPQQQGYEQFADVMYSVISYIKSL